MMEAEALCEIHGPYYSGYPRCPVCAVMDEPDEEISDDLIREYRKQFPEGEDSSGIESNPLCSRCQHSRGLHETKLSALPYGYCVHVECDCTQYQEEE